MAVGIMNGNFRAGDYRLYRKEVEASARRDVLLRVERSLMEDCYSLEGESFVEWYESDAIPAYGSTSERIRLIRERISNLEAQPHPVNEAQDIEREIDSDMVAESHDPRTPAQIDADEFAAEVVATRETDRPF